MTFRQITVFALVVGFVAVAVATLLDLDAGNRPPGGFWNLLSHPSQNTSHAQEWYLMVPPWAPGMQTALSFGAPLSQWKRLQSYDSEQVCAQIQAGLQKYAKQKLVVLPPTDQQQRAFLRAYVRTQFSQCIASDDSRIKEDSGREQAGTESESSGRPAR